MADNEQNSGRAENRAPVTLKIKFKSETLDQFIERYAMDVSRGGIFIRTKQPLAVGTQLRFEFQLRDASPLIAGLGTVVWTRDFDPQRRTAPGMGVKFVSLEPSSLDILEKILAQKTERNKRETAQPTKASARETAAQAETMAPPPAAPAPQEEAQGKPPRKKARSTFRPFLPDEDVSDSAFQEATKVQSLADLVAKTIRPDTNAAPVAPRAESEETSIWDLGEPSAETPTEATPPEEETPTPSEAEDQAPAPQSPLDPVETGPRRRNAAISDGISDALRAFAEPSGDQPATPDDAFDEDDAFAEGASRTEVLPPEEAAALEASDHPFVPASPFRPAVGDEETSEEDEAEQEHEGADTVIDEGDHGLAEPPQTIVDEGDAEEDDDATDDALGLAAEAPQEDSADGYQEEEQQQDDDEEEDNDDEEEEEEEEEDTGPIFAPQALPQTDLAPAPPPRPAAMNARERAAITEPAPLPTPTNATATAISERKGGSGAKFAIGLLLAAAAGAGGTFAAIKLTQKDGEQTQQSTSSSASTSAASSETSSAFSETSTSSASSASELSSSSADPMSSAASESSTSIENSTASASEKESRNVFVNFRVTPSDAIVTLDRKTQTTLSGVKLTRGKTYALKVSKRGFVTVRKAFKAGVSAMPVISLKELKYRVIVATRPPDAKVTYDGKVAGASPVTIDLGPAGQAPGRIRVKVTKPGYKSVSRTVSLGGRNMNVKGEVAKLVLDIPLKPNLSSQPASSTATSKPSSEATSAPASSQPPDTAP